MSINMEENILKVIRISNEMVAPPSYTPSSTAGVTSRDIQTILNTGGLLIYIWLKNGSEFWFFHVQNQNDHILGHLWDGNTWTRVHVKIAGIKTYF